MNLTVHISLQRDNDGSFFAATCPAFDDLCANFGGLPKLLDGGELRFSYYTRKKNRVAADAVATILEWLGARIRGQSKLPDDTNILFTVVWTDEAREAPETG